jgi:uncharacterized protein (DUF4415 family)
MSEENIVRYSLDEIKAMVARGDSMTIAEPPYSVDPEDELDEHFWANAVIVEPANRKSVHLRINPDVYDFFVQQTGGKGHIAKMQAVLKAYADAHR